jgi:hypothetical protein
MKNHGALPSAREGERERERKRERERERERGINSNQPVYEGTTYEMKSAWYYMKV